MSSQIERMAIGIALDADPKDFAEMRGAETILCEPRVSLIRCFALTRHLGSIAAAAERELAKPGLRHVVIPIIGRGIARGAVAITAQPTAELYEMQRRLLRVIAPGIEGVGTDGVSIAFDPHAEVEPFDPFAASVVSASIYAFTGECSERADAQHCTLLWRLAVPHR